MNKRPLVEKHFLETRRDHNARFARGVKLGRFGRWRESKADALGSKNKKTPAAQAIVTLVSLVTLDK
ncbi:MAG: hypothetical protein QM811_26210 [Pirellulales bacterium]